jgi:citrate lyase subunit beta/citryl-CoA lyase/(S)-citramalyl-CoA lyase
VHARARLVNSARAAGVEAVDAPVFAIGDMDGLLREAPLSFELGFSGKIAVHPRQIPVINEAFSPDPGTLEKARRIVAAGGSGSVGIGVVDGAMVGAPFFEASRRLIEEFGSPGDPVLSSAGNGREEQ